MSTIKKPLGITATAIYAAFSGIILLLVGFLVLIVSQIPDENYQSVNDSILFMVGGVTLCVVGVFMLAAMYGLWSLQEWGRVLSLWLFSISAVLGVISIFPIWPGQPFTVSNAVLQLIGIRIAGFIFSYLSEQDIKNLFKIENA